MEKKPLFLTFLVLSALFLTQVCFAAPDKAVTVARDRIIILIDAGKYDSAETAANKMASDFAGNDLLARRLWEVANRYDKNGAYDYSKRLCEQIAANYSKDVYATYAGLQLAKLRVFEQIDASNYETAYSEVPQILSSFAGHKQLVRRLWEIANRFDNVEAFDYAKLLSSRIIADCPKDAYAQYASLLIERLNIYDLIDAGNYEAADSAVSAMTNNFAGHKHLAKRLWEIANKYDKAEADNRSKKLCEQIAANYPKDIYAKYAALQLAKLDAFELIRNGKYEDAQNKALASINDFADHKQLARRLWEIANRFDKFKAYGYSKTLCEKIVANYPKDEYAGYAGLQLAKLKIYELIDTENYEAADAAITKMIQDFTGNKQLSRRLYETAQYYAKKGAQPYARELHGRIAALYPDEKYALRSSIQHDKLSVYAQLDANDFEAAQHIISQMKADFAGSEELCKQLDSVAEKYEHLGDIEQAKNIWHQILDACPAGSKTAVVVAARLDKYTLFSAIENGSNAQVETSIKELGNGLADSNDLDDYLYTAASDCYSRARWGQIRNDTSYIIDYFKAAVAFWERIFVECPNSPLAPGACFAAAAQSAQELGDYAKAVGYFRKVVDDWPNYQDADWAQVKVGVYLDEMARTGQITAADAKPLIIEAYQAVLANYPQSEWSDCARKGIERYEQ
ncbi:MAG: hypothetical protein PHQ00_04635 [Phycisphaerae bacterium]|nr:hypothetical protein [Phycisphaerae bacterium]